MGSFFNSIFNLINVPLGFILDWISRLFGGNFAASVFLFTLIINIVMIPLSIKSQKSAVQQTRIKPKLDALKAKYGDDRQKYSMAMQELYQKENVSMSGGCLPMLIRFPIMISIYYLIRNPLQYIAHVSTDVINSAGKQMVSMGLAKEADLVANGQIMLLNNAEKLGVPEISDAASQLNFNFFGIDLTKTPKFSMDIIHNIDVTWIIPVLAFAAAMLTSIISLRIQKKANPDAPNMAFMMLSMPLISLFIAFGMPCAVGFYWACSSLIAGLIQAVVQVYYGPNMIIAKETSLEISKAYKKELERAKKINEGKDEE